MKDPCTNIKKAENLVKQSNDLSTLLIGINEYLDNKIDAEKFCRRFPEMTASDLEKISEDEIKQMNINKYEFMKEATDIYHSITLSQLLDEDVLFIALASYVKYVPDMGYDILIRWRDSIPHLNESQINKYIRLFGRVVKSNSFSSHERAITAVTLYNNGFINEAYDCFINLAADDTVLIQYRIDAWFYLIGSGDKSYVDMAWDYVHDFISNKLGINELSSKNKSELNNGFTSSFRYGVIAKLISTYGIVTFLNRQRINLPYDQDFVIGLQKTFFFDELNNKHERILSGQHILQMDYEKKTIDYTEVTDDEGNISLKEVLEIETDTELIDIKSRVTEILLSFANDETLERNLRRQAVDVVLREGYPSNSKNMARDIIANLGYSELNEGKTVIDRTKTLYNDSENAHKFWDYVEPYLIKLIEDNSIRLRQFHEVQAEIASVISERTRGIEKLRSLQTLNRISIDTATFTKYKVTMADILIHIWIRIQSHRKHNDIDSLIQRLIDELKDMSDTCSTGHAARLVMVLDQFEFCVTIGWEEQIISNMTARLNAALRDMKDEHKQEIIVLASIDDTGDRDEYKNIIAEEIDKIYREMYNEFVVAAGGYIKSNDFDRYFDKGKKVLYESLKL